VIDEVAWHIAVDVGAMSTELADQEMAVRLDGIGDEMR